MAGKKPGVRGPKIVTALHMKLRRALARNVQALIDAHYPLSKYRIKSDQQKAVKENAGVSWSTIQRALNPAKGAKTLDTVADIAAAFVVHPSDLLRDDFIVQRKDGAGGDAAAAGELHRRRG